MMKKTGIMIILGSIAVAVFLNYQVSVALPAGSNQLKIAVVNVTKVLTECQANLDRKEEEKARLNKIEAELKGLSAEADAIKEELQNALTPGSEEFMAKRKDWFNKQAQLQALQEYQKEALSVDKQAWTETLYNNLLNEISSVARQQNCVLVLNKDESTTKTRNLSELLNLIVNRKVLYNAPTMDLTAVVLERMDRLHEKEKAAGK